METARTEVKRPVTLRRLLRLYVLFHQTVHPTAVHDCLCAFSRSPNVLLPGFWPEEALGSSSPTIQAATCDDRMNERRGTGKPFSRVFTRQSREPGTPIVFRGTKVRGGDAHFYGTLYILPATRACSQIATTTPVNVKESSG